MPSQEDSPGGCTGGQPCPGGQRGHGGAAADLGTHCSQGRDLWTLLFKGSGYFLGSSFVDAASASAHFQAVTAAQGQHAMVLISTPCPADAGLMRPFLLLTFVAGNLLHSACLRLTEQVPAGQCRAAGQLQDPYARAATPGTGLRSVLLPRQHGALRGPLPWSRSV